MLQCIIYIKYYTNNICHIICRVIYYSGSNKLKIYGSNYEPQLRRCNTA